MNILQKGAAWIASQSLAAYLVRGVAAVTLFAAGYMLFDTSAMLGATLMFSALIPLGGCPGCWIGGTIGAACAYIPQKNSPRRIDLIQNGRIYIAP